MLGSTEGALRGVWELLTENVLLAQLLAWFGLIILR